MRVLPVGTDAVLLELSDLDAAVRLHAQLGAELREGSLPGVAELVPAARTVLVRLVAGRSGERARHLLAERRLPPAGAAELVVDGAEVVELPVVYDGDDLPEVARLTGLTEAEVVRRHTATPWTVAFTGFAPGFGYLVGGDPALRVPRREVPRPRVPAGAVGLAGEFSGVYPRASPGGWQLLGTTAAALWDVDREPPALLRPGVRVRFHAVTTLPTPLTVRDHGLPRRVVTSGRAASPAAAGLEVVDPGVLTTVQDLGRPGRAGLGVSASGALDRASLRRAHRAVGNAPGAPALENTGGLVVRAVGRIVVAVTGAQVAVHVERVSGAREPTVLGLPIALDDGDVVVLGAPVDQRTGAAAYLAVRGSLDVPTVLGSAARDVLAGLGPDPVRAGDVLPLGRGWLTGSVAVVAERAPPLVERELLDVVLGPRDDWFDAASLALLTTQDWVVTPLSNRVGLRLQGARPLVRGGAGGSVEHPADLPSEGVVRGALQVPPNGQPVLFGPDHPVTGGYPVIACVAEHHLDRAGQLPVGAAVRFRAAPSVS